MVKKTVLLIIMILLGLGYRYAIAVEIKSDRHTLTLSSTIPQTVKVHLKRLSETASLVCNEEDVPFIDPKKPDYFYHGEEEVTLTLHRGENICQTQNIAHEVKIKLSGVDFTVLFLLWGVPLYRVIYWGFIRIMAWVRRRLYGTRD